MNRLSRTSTVLTLGVLCLLPVTLRAQFGTLFLAVDPTEVVGGSGATGAVSFINAGLFERVVQITTSDPSIVSTPASVTVPPRQRRAIFPITTQVVDSALLAVGMAVRLRPELTQSRHYMVQLAGEFGRLDVLDSLISVMPRDLHADLYFNYALSSDIGGDPARALPVYRQALQSRPTHTRAFQRVAVLLSEKREFDTLLLLLDLWMAANPHDSLGPAWRTEVLRLLNEQAPPADEGRP